MDAAARRDELLEPVRVGLGRILAYTTLAMVPAVVFYAIAERQIVSGLTAGSVKG